MAAFGVWRAGVVLLLLCVCYVEHTAVESEIQHRTPDASATFERKAYNPCCLFPCKNGGICSERGATYECDCTGLEYWGRNCSTPYTLRAIKDAFLPGMEIKQALPGKYKWLWDIINAVPMLQRRAMKYIYMSRGLKVESPPRYTSQYEYITLNSYYNRTYYARDLPPLPSNCPTFMGTAGPVELPTEDELYERILKRRHFKPCPLGTNLLFISYAQHFTHQFFKTDSQRGPGLTWGANEGVDVSQIYGPDEVSRNALRSFKDGKLKTRVLDGEEFPPYLEDAPGVDMVYPDPSNMDSEQKRKFPMASRESASPRWALGHRLMSMTPLLFVVCTLWLREHNRVCDLLRAEHPRWDDTRLYETARLIVAAEMVKVTLTDYVQQLSQYHIRLTFDPQLTHGTQYQFSNRIREEFVHMYNWHSMVPESVHVDDDTYTFEEMLFTNNSVVLRHGMDAMVRTMVHSVAGMVRESIVSQ